MSRKFLTGIDVNSQRITSVADPSAANDAANRQYVDAVARGLAWKDSVVAASTTSGALATAYDNGETLDGVVLATGNRILLKDQATGSENGIYIVQASGAPVRAGDLPSGDDAKGVAVTVEKGTTNGDKVFIQTADTAIVGTDALTFSQLGGGGATYSADGNGIELSGTTFSLELDGTTLAKGASGLRVGSGAAGSGLTETSGVLAVGGGTGITVNADDVAINTSVVARRAVFTSDAAQTKVCTHNISADVMVQVYRVSDGAVVETDITSRTSTAVTVDFGAAVGAGDYKIIVIG